jgi:polyisoprenoid-binding protein YceI
MEEQMTADLVDTRLPLSSGTWNVDPNHSSVNFKVRHIGLTNVRGRFNKFTASFNVGTSVEGSSVQAVIEMSSVDTNQPDRDAHLRSTDFFSIEQHPQMLFSSRSIAPDGDGYVVDGDLTINGIAKPVSLGVEFDGVQVFPGDGSTHAGFSASTEINRDDFGVDFNMPLGVDRFALGKKIAIEIDIQFVAPKQA